jgi:hypothetical protein
MKELVHATFKLGNLTGRDHLGVVGTVEWTILK